MSQLIASDATHFERASHLKLIDNANKGGIFEGALLAAPAQFMPFICAMLICVLYKLEREAHKCLLTIPVHDGGDAPAYAFAWKRREQWFCGGVEWVFVGA